MLVRERATPATLRYARLQASPMLTALEEPADFDATMLVYQGIQDDVARRYGSEVSALPTSRRFPRSPPVAADTVCSARIYQVERMLKQPKATAAMLIDSALR
jgi:hypothetical protein